MPEIRVLSRPLHIATQSLAHGIVAEVIDLLWFHRRRGRPERRHMVTPFLAPDLAQDPTGGVYPLVEHDAEPA